MGVKRWIPGAIQRLLGSPEQADADVREELRFHLEERAAELMAEGVAEAEARRRAVAEFGDAARHESETRRVAHQRLTLGRWRRGLDVARQDLRFTGRILARSPGFTLAAVLTLALGIGATTAVFTVVDAVLLRPLPFPDADRLVVVWESSPEAPRDPTSPPNFVDFRDGTTGFDALVGWEDLSLTLTGLERPEVLSGTGFTGEFFVALGVPALIGRVLRDGDEADVVVISHRLWQTRFGGDPEVLGRVLQLEGQPYEVVGVMPPEFRVPRDKIDFWIRTPIEQRNEYRSSRFLHVLGRLRPGVSPAMAESELNAVAVRLEREYPVTNRDYRVVVVPARDEVVGEAGEALVVVLGAVALLLLLAAVNVSNMLLGRAASRAHEYGVRSALGASGARLRNQLLVESLVLGGTAGALGVAVAYGGVAALLRLEPEAIPRAAEVGLDYRVLGFALLVSLGVSVAAGLFPGLRAARTGPAAVLRGSPVRGGGPRDRVRRGLIVAELALSLVLLVGGALLFRTFVALRALDPGYATEDVLTAKVHLGGSPYTSSESRVRYFETLLERVRAVPGVQAAGVTTTIPLSRAGIDFGLAYRRESDPPLPEDELPEASYRIVSPGYLDAMGMRLIRGRDLSPADRAGTAPVTLINRAFAERLWPGEDPIGRRIIVHYIADEGIAWQVVGVVEDTRHQGLAVAAEPQFFVPIAQAEFLFSYMTVVVRTLGAPAVVADALNEIAIEIEPTEPLYDYSTMAELRAGAMARERLAAALTGIFAVLALILSATGVYGVVSYQVARRTREIGVRMALGAARGRVLGLVVGEVAATAAIGLMIGLVGAALASRLIAGLLFGVDRFDPLTYAAVALLLMGTALLAAWLPARRAARVDPVRALRTE